MSKSEKIQSALKKAKFLDCVEVDYNDINNVYSIEFHEEPDAVMFEDFCQDIDLTVARYNEDVVFHGAK